LITLVRKGSRERQELPASPDAFVWLRLYQVEMEGLIPRGRTQPLWWTRRKPFRPLTYHAVHRMFERVNADAGTTALPPTPAATAATASWSMSIIAGRRRSLPASYIQLL
jgi:hypothetical protein